MMFNKFIAGITIMLCSSLVFGEYHITTQYDIYSPPANLDLSQMKVGDEILVGQYDIGLYIAADEPVGPYGNIGCYKSDLSYTGTGIDSGNNDFEFVLKALSSDGSTVLVENVNCNNGKLFQEPYSSDTDHNRYWKSQLWIKRIGSTGDTTSYLTYPKVYYCFYNNGESGCQGSQVVANPWSPDKSQVIITPPQTCEPELYWNGQIDPNTIRLDNLKGAIALNNEAEDRNRQYFGIRPKSGISDCNSKVGVTMTMNATQVSQGPAIYAGNDTYAFVVRDITNNQYVISGSPILHEGTSVEYYVNYFRTNNSVYHGELSSSVTFEVIYN
ncbi:hypothetical protein GCM10010995_21300 [Cysteiniphilum litorale]|uniref:Fimbrial protein n=2 Tax=Fastidiosibacteraceae TaxID=2056687 RepID=A0A8J2Z5U0_9GAMM|nr:hypothetical protein GCM10010995_21300 [Cysteiniphilum litorale]